MSADVGHSKLGASIAKRWMTCPGSVAACEGLPEERESQAAWDGTCAHRVAQLCLENGEYNANEYVGLELEAKGRKFVATAEMVEAVNVYLNAVYGNLFSDDELYVEQTVDLSEIHKGMFGTGDAAVLKIKDRHLHVFDFKYGAGIVVEVEDNPQVKFYGEGFRRAFREFGIRQVTCWIVQPRAPHAQGSVRSVTYEALELMDFAGELQAAAKRTAEPNAPRVAGEHCRFCRAASTCPAFREKAVAAASDVFGKIVDPRTFSAEELGERLSEAELLRTYLKVLDEHAYQFARTVVPRGWKWVAGKGRRVWRHAEETILASIKAAIGRDVSEVSCPSPTQVEKLVGKEAYTKLLPLVEFKNASPSLVREGDKRAAISLEEVAAVGKGDAFAPIVQPA